MKKLNNNWSESVKAAVWKKGKINPDFSPDVLRWDAHGHIMMWSEYGRTDSKLGWDIGSIDQIAIEGEEEIDTLQPFNIWYKENSME